MLGLGIQDLGQAQALHQGHQAQVLLRIRILRHPTNPILRRNHQ